MQVPYLTREGLMDYLFIVCIAILLFFILSHVNRKPKPLHVQIFIGWMVLLLFTVLSFFISQKGLLPDLFWYHELMCFTHVLHGPILYFYIRSFISDSFRFGRKDFIHLIPVAVYVSYHGITQLLGLASCAPGGEMESTDNAYSSISTFMKFGILAAYTFAGASLVRQVRYNTQLDKKKKISVYNWLESIIRGVVFLLSLTLLIEVLFYFDIPFAVAKESLINVIVTIFILTFIYIWNRYSFVLLGPMIYEKEKERYKSGLEETELDKNYATITNFLEKSEAYLDKDLTLKKMSSLTGLSEHLISETVNRKANKSYSDFINAYRVQCFLEKIEAGEHKTNTLLGIALECGFNSKSTFNRAFKQFSNQTPSAYIQELSKKSPPA